MIPLMVHHSEERQRAFTRLELLACVGAVSLLLTVIIPALATSGSRSDRVLCLNNLRQIGLGLSQFALEHGDRPPWRVLWNEGGTSDSPVESSASFVQFSIMSNSVSSPRILACPADTRISKRIAERWDMHPNGGLWSPSFRNNSISYFLGLDGGFRAPRSVLAGDRNVRTDGSIGGCSSGIVPAYTFYRGWIYPWPAWTNDVHGLSGNLLYHDGAVDQVDTLGLRAAAASGEEWGSGGLANHILPP